MRALKCTNLNDLALTVDPISGKKQITFEDDALVAGMSKLYRRFQFFEGEWFLDTRLGFPWFKYVFVKSPDFTLIRSLIRQTILSVDVIARVDAIPFEFNKATRTASFSFDAVAADGRIVHGGDPPKPFIVDGRDIHRPVGSVLE